MIQPLTGLNRGHISIKYGSNINRLAALLTMLNSCANEVPAGNIDHGFGVGSIASQINRNGFTSYEK